MKKASKLNPEKALDAKRYGFNASKRF